MIHENRSSIVAGLALAVATFFASPSAMAFPVGPAPVEAPVGPAPAAAPAMTTPGPVEAAPQPQARADGPREDSVAAAKMVGTEAFGASAYFIGYGVTVSGMAGLYGDTGSYPAPGIQIGLLVAGIVNTSVGTALAVVGARRLRADDAWLDARPGRRARFAAKARRRGLYLYDGPVDGATADVVGRGRKTGLAGALTLLLGGAMNGVGVGVSPIAPGAGITLAVLGTSAMVTGAIVAARGKKMAFRPHDYLPGRGTMAVAPTMVMGVDGRRMPGLSLVARW